MRPGRPKHGSAVESRERLLNAATILFGERGLDGVSTRELASQAGVNLSAITYHFGGKEGLYEAVLHAVVDELAPRRSAVIKVLGASVDAVADDSEALSEVVAQFVRILLEAEANPVIPLEHIKLLMRELHHPTEARSIVVDGHINPMYDAITGLVAAATNKNPQAEETKLLGLGVAQMLLLHGLMRPLVLARMGWDDYTPERTGEIVGTTITMVQRILALPETINQT